MVNHPNRSRALTKEKLERFIRIRNESGFASNLQFQADADEAGFSAGALGWAEKIALNEYHWRTPFGRLVELNGVLSLEA